MQMRKSRGISIFALLAFGSWLLAVVGMFLPWVTVTVKMCVLFVCSPEIAIYSASTSFLQFLVPINLSDIVSTLDQNLVSFIVAQFFPTFNQYLVAMIRAAYVLLGSIIVLFVFLIIFALQSRGKHVPHQLVTACALVAALVGLAAVYVTMQTLTEIQQQVQGTTTALGPGFWTIGSGLVLTALIMLAQLLRTWLLPASDEGNERERQGYSERGY